MRIGAREFVRGRMAIWDLGGTGWDGMGYRILVFCFSLCESREEEWKDGSIGIAFRVGAWAAGLLVDGLDLV